MNALHHLAGDRGGINLGVNGIVHDAITQNRRRSRQAMSWGCEVAWIVVRTYNIELGKGVLGEVNHYP